MAITTVNPRYEGFIFDGENSRNYGIYVQDVKVFGAPTRDVEMISIPGRDGEFALDKGRFNNIQVVYTCAFGTDTQTDFNTGVSDFRNWLASRKGYKRLEDEINTAEYRMAVFKDGLDVSTLNKETGTFEVTFDCKPQRFLKSGETAVTVTSGGTITNPTLFESRPLLMVDGYGNIDINGETINIDNTITGEIELAAGDSTYSINNNVKTFSQGAIRTGDTITLAMSEIEAAVNSLNGVTITGYSGAPTITMGETYVNEAVPSIGYSAGNPYPTLRINTTLKSIQFTAGTSSTKNISIEQNATYTYNGTSGTFKMSVSISVAYTSGRIGITCTTTTTMPTDFQDKKPIYRTGAVTAYSTKSALGTPLYFDLDIGEAYKVENGEYISVNNAVSFPAELPTLKAGNNTITFDNTVDSLKIVPRWWEV